MERDNREKLASLHLTCGHEAIRRVWRLFGAKKEKRRSCGLDVETESSGKAALPGRGQKTAPAFKRRMGGVVQQVAAGAALPLRFPEPSPAGRRTRFPNASTAAPEKHATGEVSVNDCTENLAPAFVCALSSREVSSSCFWKQLLTGHLRVRAPGKAWEIDNSFFLPEVENQGRH